VLARVVLRTSRARAALLLLVLAASLGFALFAATGARRTSSALERFIAWSEPSDVETGGSGGDIPIGERLDELAALEPVLDSQRSQTILIHGADLGDGELLAPPRFTAVALSAFQDRFDRVKVLRGRLPDDDTPNVGVVDFVTAGRLDLDVGDRIVLHAFAGPDGSGTRLVPVEIGAVFSSPRALPTVAGFHFNAVALGPQFLVENPELSDPWEASLSIRLRNGPGAVDELRAAMDEAGLEDIDLAVTLESTSVGAERLFSLEATAMWLAAALSLLVGLTIAYQIMRRDATAHREVIDTLVALGASRQQLLAAATIRGLVLGVLAAAVAAAGAIMASPASPVGMARNAEIDRGVRVDLLVLGVGLPLFVTAIAGMFVTAVWLGARSRGGSTANVGTSLGLAGHAPAAIGLRMATAGRQAAGGLAAVVVVAVLVVGMVVVADNLAAVPYDAERTGGVWDAFLAIEPDLREEVDRVLDSAPEVLAHGDGGWTQLQVGPEYLYAITLPSVEGIEPAIVAGRAPRGEREVALGARAMERLGVGIGDEIDATLSDSEDPEVVRLEVTGETIVAAPLFQTHAPDDAALLAAGVGGAQPGGDFQLLRFADDRDPEAAFDDVTGRLPEGGLQFGFARGERGDVFALSRLDGLVGALLAMVVGLAVASVLHQLLVAHRRHARVLAVLRALGFTRGDTAVTGAGRGFASVGVGMAVGIPIGVAAGAVAWRYLARQLVVLPDVTIPAAVIAVGVISVAALATLAAAALAGRVGRHPVAEVLRAE
jgi:ABC-type lipoprotein release transport system permease subunit